MPGDGSLPRRSTEVSPGRAQVAAGPGGPLQGGNLPQNDSKRVHVRLLRHRACHTQSTAAQVNAGMARCPSNSCTHGGEVCCVCKHEHMSANAAALS